MLCTKTVWWGTLCLGYEVGDLLESDPAAHNEAGESAFRELLATPQFKLRQTFPVENRSIEKKCIPWNSTKISRQLRPPKNSFGSKCCP